jgi:uncharacterized membrane protein YphA (DoxX/SURF4 family)
VQRTLPAQRAACSDDAAEPGEPAPRESTEAAACAQALLVRRPAQCLLYFTAAADFAGGLGILLPSLTRIKPGLVVLAALGCVALQASAVVFHFSRGEAANTPFNFLLIALSVFVAWGRRTAPIRPRL